MKASEHKTTFREVLEYLRAEPAHAVELGDRFWPDKAAYGPARGGPSSSTVAASFMLGRLRKRGFVQAERYKEGAASYTRHHVTTAGIEWLSQQPEQA